MTHRSQSSVNIQRRDLLKSATGVSVFTLGIAEGIDLAQASGTPFELGEVRFIEVAEEYSSPESAIKTSRNGMAQYSIDRENKIVALSGGEVPQIEKSDILVSSGGRLTTSKEFRISEETRGLPIDTNFRQLGAKYVALNDKYSSPAVKCEPGGKELSLSTEGAKIVPDQNLNAPLQTTTPPLDVAGVDGTNSLERELRVRDYGTVTVYGSDKYQIYPTGSSDKYAQARVGSLVALAPGETSKLDAAELVAAPKNIEVASTPGDI